MRCHTQNMIAVPSESSRICPGRRSSWWCIVRGATMEPRRLDLLVHRVSFLTSYFFFSQLLATVLDLSPSSLATPISPPSFPTSPIAATITATLAAPSFTATVSAATVATALVALAALVAALVAASYIAVSSGALCER